MLHLRRTLTALAAVVCAAHAGLRTAAADDALLRDNVVVLLDTSGSMKEEMGRSGRKKIDVAREALRTVLANLPETTQVGLLVFASRNADPWVHPLGPIDRARLESAIAQAEPRGRTPLGEYLKIAADRLLEARAAQLGYGTYRLLVVTDGEASDKGLVAKHLPEILGRGLTVDAIGVDMKESHSLATTVHSYRRADDPETLVRSLQEVFAEVGRADADDGGVDHYAVIAPLPDGAANLLLAGLARSGNEPIGRAAPPAAAPAASDAAAPAPSGGSRPDAPDPSAPSSFPGVGGLVTCAMVAVFLLFVFVRLARIAGGRG